MSLFDRVERSEKREEISLIRLFFFFFQALQGIFSMLPPPSCIALYLGDASEDDRARSETRVA